MPIKIDVLIYFEHVVRELDACIILKKRLNQLGVSAEIVPVHYNRYRTFIKYAPKIIVVPFLYADKNDIVYKEFNDMYGDIIILNLHHEQLYNDMTKALFMPKNEISKNAYHLSWGERFANDLMEVGVKKKLITICGNPRTDNYFCLPSSWIREKYCTSSNQEIIFIPTSFSWAFVDEKYFIENAKMDPIEFHKKKDLTYKSATDFLFSIRKLAKKFPKKLFVVRPHPFEKNETYEKILKSFDNSDLEKNIVIAREGNVYDWIKECRIMIGWITTVTVEACQFNKKNIIYTPHPIDEGTKTDFMKKFEPIITTYEELESIVGNIDQYHIKNQELMDELSRTMGKTDGKVNQRLAEFIRNILPIQKNVKINIRVYGKNLIKSIVIDCPKNILKNLGLLTMIRPIYSGVTEDMLSYKSIEKAINSRSIIQ